MYDTGQARRGYLHLGRKLCQREPARLTQFFYLLCYIHKIFFKYKQKYKFILITITLCLNKQMRGPITRAFIPAPYLNIYFRPWPILPFLDKFRYG